MQDRPIEDGGSIYVDCECSDPAIEGRAPAPPNPLTNELHDLIVLMPDSQVDELLDFIRQLRAARAPHEPPAEHEAPAVHHKCIDSGAWCRVLKRWEPDGAAQQFDYECTRCKQKIIVNVGEFKLEAQASRPAPLLDWQPIPRLTEASRQQKPFTLPVWGFGPTLIDADFNPTGVVEMYYQDDEGWIGAIWNGEQDCWDAKTIKPTHWCEVAPPAAHAAPTE